MTDKLEKEAMEQVRLDVLGWNPEEREKGVHLNLALDRES